MSRTLELTRTASDAPPPSVQYYRIRHDNPSRTSAPNWHGVGTQTPEVFPCMLEPNASSGTFRTHVVDFESFFRGLQTGDSIASAEQKYNYLTADNTALFNTFGWDKYESIVMGGNVVTLDEIQGNWGRIHTLKASDPVPSASVVDFDSVPWLVHKFTVVSYAQNYTHWVNTPKGVIYYPLITNDGGMWIEMSKLYPVSMPFKDPLETDG